jgi:hypothetical protein
MRVVSKVGKMNADSKKIERVDGRKMKDSGNLNMSLCRA